MLVHLVWWHVLEVGDVAVVVCSGFLELHDDELVAHLVYLVSELRKIVETIFKKAERGSSLAAWSGVDCAFRPYNDSVFAQCFLHFGSSV